ncbi:hypothetical protein [Ancylobacter rudongensis]|uniref:hypothetical protein n=1 Tax=Ancylobacter rudongensis TaxID=177413 RepID=UPI00115FA21A|nr:hypothetical protein [Ancylobacter rudongensis]
MFYYPTEEEKAAYEAIGRFALEWGKLEHWLYLNLFHAKVKSSHFTTLRIKNWTKLILKKYGEESGIGACAVKCELDLLNIMEVRHRLIHGALGAINDNSRIIMLYVGKTGENETTIYTIEQLHDFCHQIGLLKGVVNMINSGNIPLGYPES